MSITVSVSQHAREVLVEDDVIVSVSQLVRETLVVDRVLAQTSQVVRELLVSGSNPQVSQIAREILMSDIESVSYPTPYPQLVGLSWSVLKRAVGGSTAVAKAASGREIRINYWTYPEWEWDLVYDYLPDMPASGTTASDLRDLMGFCLANFGSFSAFPFQDPSDYQVTGQQIGTGNGTQVQFTLIKNYGLGSLVGTEPIGWLNTDATFNVYISGVLQTGGGVDYTLYTTSPYNQYVVFTSAVPSGDAVTVDMSYYFMARLKTDSTEFEEFFERFWSLQKITLVSLKGT